MAGREVEMSSSGLLPRWPPVFVASRCFFHSRPENSSTLRGKVLLNGSSRPAKFRHLKEHPDRPVHSQRRADNRE